MPHIMIEYSANIAEHHDVDALVARCTTPRSDTGLPPVDGLRTRAAVRDHFRIADGSADLAFVAIADSDRSLGAMPPTKTELY